MHACRDVLLDPMDQASQLIEHMHADTLRERSGWGWIWMARATVVLQPPSVDNCSSRRRMAGVYVLSHMTDGVHLPVARHGTVGR